jgi:ornithine carbamoyltransferase
VHVGLEGAARGRRRSGFERVLSAGRAAQVLLDREQVLLSSLDDREELRHRRHLFTLLLEKPVQELLTDELPFLARELHEVDDLLGDPLLLREREGHGSDDIRECGLGGVDARRDDVVIGVEEVLHHHHRVVPFLHGLAVEVRCELREVLGVVVDRDGDVLLRRGELVPDLAVQGVCERRHGATLDDRGRSIRTVAGVPQHLKGRSFTRVASWSQDELATLLDLADELKAERVRRHELRVLPGRTIGLIFHKPSTRTRVAFEVGMAELGGMALFLPAGELQLTRGESYRDTAIVLSRFLSALMIRTFEQEEVETFAEHASIPVINGLTDETHPLQALADAMTLRERFGSLQGIRLAYVGDGNNVCHSLMRIAGRFGVEFVAATPAGYEPDPAFVAAAAKDAKANGGSVELLTDPRDAASGAHAVYTDVWTSMGQETDRARRLRDLEPYRIDDALLAVADLDGVAMHCLPAHVGEEITADVLYGPRCLAWEQAENRLHTQKALMALVIR